MEEQQKLEWSDAQNIVISEDLVAAAKRQLQFLAAVDRNQNLYSGPALEHAICRYKYCWLPLLAKHTSSPVSEGPLVVPLDCEWIWHCHRLNPDSGHSECFTSVEGPCSKQTETIWNRLYPNEPYELDVAGDLTKSDDGDIVKVLRSTKYDLVAAVKRQSSFFKKVSHMNDDVFLEEAVKRYKGFLHLTRRNRKSPCVPTIDIDLIWHSHQLSPVSYSQDMMALLGTLLGHDDTDPNRTEVGGVAVGFSCTTSLWEETFGMRYVKARVMNRDCAPSPLNSITSKLNSMTKEVVSFDEIWGGNILNPDSPLHVKDQSELIGKYGSVDSNVVSISIVCIVTNSMDANICIDQN